jgi:hypothetical protein
VPSDQFGPGGGALERRRQFLKQRGLPQEPVSEPPDEESPGNVSPTEAPEGGTPVRKRSPRKKKK